VIGLDSSYSLLACFTPQRKGAGPGLEPIPGKDPWRSGRPGRAVEVRKKDKEIKSLKVREMIPSSSRPVEG
jgi:hypothetical protein